MGTVDEARVRAAVGQRILSARKARELTQRDLASAAATTVGYVNALEKGRKNPTIIMLARIATALGSSPADLISELPRLGSAPKRVAKRYPRHVAALADDLTALPTAERTRALTAVRTLLRFSGHRRLRMNQKIKS